MSNDDSLIREAWADWSEQSEPGTDWESFRAGFRAALEARPSLVVRGEEELATWLAEAGVLYASDLANSMVGGGIVAMAPSLVAESREAVVNFLAPHIEAAQHPHHRTEVGPDALDEFYLATVVADALLAPGGPVRLAATTPEQAWNEGYDAAARFHEGREKGRWENDSPRPGMRSWVADPAPSNPYDGFTRKEQNE